MSMTKVVKAIDVGGEGEDIYGVKEYCNILGRAEKLESP